jgi:hypothetical protein
MFFDGFFDDRKKFSPSPDSNDNNVGNKKLAIDAISISL